MLQRGERYDERQVAVRNRAWRRTCCLILAGLVVTAFLVPEHGVGAQAIVLTVLAMGSQAAQGIWGGAYLKVNEDPRPAAVTLVFLTGMTGYAFIEYGVTTGQWWDAGNPLRFVAFFVCLVVLGVALTRWSVDRWGSDSAPEKPRRWPKWDERQQAARDRAWRRTCIAVLAVLWVVAEIADVFNLSVSVMQMSVVLFWAAIGFHAMQVVWSGAYDRSGETSSAFIVGGALCVFGFLGYVAKITVSDGEGLDFDHIALALPMIPILAAVLATSARRWVDRRAASE